MDSRGLVLRFRSVNAPLDPQGPPGNALDASLDTFQTCKAKKQKMFF